MPGNMVTSDFKIVEVVQRKGKFHVLLILGESNVKYRGKGGRYNG